MLDIGLLVTSMASGVELFQHPSLHPLCLLDSATHNIYRMLDSINILHEWSGIVERDLTTQILEALLEHTYVLTPLLLIILLPLRDVIPNTLGASREYTSVPLCKYISIYYYYYYSHMRRVTAKAGYLYLKNSNPGN